MSKESKSDNGPVIIKRYASRKLYDADAKEYVTIDDIARYIREGREVQIVDKNTGEDLTRQYLVQIIADFESQGESALPTNILTDLVRHYQEQASSMTNTLAGAMSPAFLGQMFETFKHQQEKILSDLGEMQGRAMNPERMLDAVNDAMGGAMKEWQERQGEFFAQAMRQWGFGGMAADRSADESANPDGSGVQKAAQRTSQGADDGGKGEPQGKEDRIRSIEANLKNLQDELDKLR